ncbi:DNA/RNA non-specific endonuclease [Herbiconiux sp. CPCC 203407]|uniref:DNA/RNA non-specific endonuclease n=1 Tax=Herbiconiux oxytropis TaxID=2970915 RepID=A0AA41XIX6_9MICO|nr:DNA/RNA non-specific endonuclease [Herbiconiux oxytropis]MCS5722313.1 DNA/RNA non-specific endonuclease [Herbiconiux oxytropis]MCS5727290.1 DNA/RNA non-specific endonuclease [Herbiconiux oxytropis]
MPSGFDPAFLDAPCPLPVPDGQGADGTSRLIRHLDYEHFTVLLDADRRLAALTAVNIDGGTLADVPRGDDWHLDERVPADEQAGPALYARNDLDRGHLVRRRDPVWGAPEVARRANSDTFAYTNAAPQAAGFNQSKELWNGLEDHVLAYADANDLRLSVFTGPVFAPTDAVYRGIRIPERFWKIAAWTADAGTATSSTTGTGTGTASTPRLRAAGFLLDQSPQLGDLDLDEARASALARDEPPPLGPFRTFQAPIADIAALVHAPMPDLVAADGYLAPLRAAGRRWTRLDSLTQIRL